MQELIRAFIDHVKSSHVEVYNEFSLQHELGIFMRDKLKEKTVQFERNVSFFGFDKTNFIKKEMDISIFNNDKSYLEAVELKYPRNGQHPEQMFSFCKDIMFLEQLLEGGFKKASLLIFACDPCFYSGKCKGIYSYFRGKKILTGRIQKPTVPKNKELYLKGSYVVNWHPIIDSLQYAFIEANVISS